MASDRVIFMHIPKAAGQTIYGIVGRQYRRDEVLILKGNVGEIFTPTSDAWAARVILGHVRFGLHENLPGPSTYVTFLREPVSRVRSLYRYIATSPRHPLHHLVAGATMLDFVSGNVDVEEVDNGQVRQISGLERGGTPDASTLARAKEILVESCLVVGLTERFDEGVMLLRKRLGWRMPYYVPKNVTQQAPPSDPSDDEARRIIKQRNALDIDLYQFACDRFNEQMREEGLRFRLDVSLFRGLNAAARISRAARDATRAIRTKNASTTYARPR